METYLNMRNRLLLSKCYLVGPMDAVEDAGAGWRKDLTPWLEDRGVIVFNPCDKPVYDDDPDYLEDVDFGQKRKALIESEQWDELANLVKPVRFIDLRMVDSANFLIVNLDFDYKICGSWEELFIGNRQMKPIIIHCPQGKKQVPGWLFATLPHQMFFQTWDEVKQYLVRIDEEEQIDTFGRWKFFDLASKTRRALLGKTQWDD